jgi:hypothetical protein
MLDKKVDIIKFWVWFFVILNCVSHIITHPVSYYWIIMIVVTIISFYMSVEK